MFSPVTLFCLPAEERYFVLQRSLPQCLDIHRAEGVVWGSGVPELGESRTRFLRRTMSTEQRQAFEELFPEGVVVNVVVVAGDDPRNARKFSTVSLSGGHRPDALPLTLEVEGVPEPGEGLSFFVHRCMTAEQRAMLEEYFRDPSGASVCTWEVASISLDAVTVRV
ncbi:MAG TPA: hypothetical protein PK393_04080 [Synergistaceae bacterium]|nr:hypothetical protein [Synergistaceae bacterium]HQK24681.1 hypothetical protein [Synergistaceae bacterium]